jgi:hypothetical protein
VGTASSSPLISGSVPLTLRPRGAAASAAPLEKGAALNNNKLAIVPAQNANKDLIFMPEVWFRVGNATQHSLLNGAHELSEATVRSAARQARLPVETLATTFGHQFASA